MNTPYTAAQRAMAELKGAIYDVLKTNPDGLRNVDIGEKLGIYTGHERHEGHISRTLLAIMESEGVVVQNEDTKIWKLK